MEDFFKQKLLGLVRPLPPQTFGEALMGKPAWAGLLKVKELVSDKTKTNFTERAQVLESLERFAQEVIEPLPEKTLKIDRGEVQIRPDPVWEGISSYGNFKELMDNLSLSPEILDFSLAQKTPGKISILFVSESFRPLTEVAADKKENLNSQFLAAFPLKTAELFARMVEAMKLTQNEVIIYPSESGEDDLSNEVMKIAAFFRPELIVTLGAKATHKILKGQERLALVHGQFFNRKIENVGTFNIVPLFHPSIIETNQNMKKTAWSDMQKIMKHLKKLP